MARAIRETDLCRTPISAYRSAREVPHPDRTRDPGTRPCRKKTSGPCPQKHGFLIGIHWHVLRLGVINGRLRSLASRGRPSPVSGRILTPHASQTDLAGHPPHRGSIPGPDLRHGRSAIGREYASDFEDHPPPLLISASSSAKTHQLSEKILTSGGERKKCAVHWRARRGHISSGVRRWRERSSAPRLPPPR